MFIFTNHNIFYKSNSIIKTIKATILKGSLEMGLIFISSPGRRSKGLANIGEIVVGLNIKCFSLTIEKNIINLIMGLIRLKR